MSILWIILPIVVLIGIVAIYFLTRKRGKEEKQNDNGVKPQPALDETEAIAIKSDTWYMCTSDLMPYVAGVVYLGVDIDPKIKQWYKYFRVATEKEIKHQYPEPETPETPEEPEVKPDPTPNFPEEVNKVLDKFSSEMTIPKNGVIYNYLIPVYVEAYHQYYKKESKLQLPIFLREENFPNIFNFYGDKGDELSAFNTLIGWLFALILSEINPTKRTSIFKIGYELGGYNRYSNIYGYKFEYDPNVVRLVAASIYASCRGRMKPDTDKMRAEIATSRYSKDLRTLMDGKRDNVEEKDFFIDLREFMPTAPGPYAPGYTSRPDDTYPNEEKDEYRNLKVDRFIHENVVIPNYNLDTKIEEDFQNTVQAIADKDADSHHLFGDNIQTEHYHFHPVFGEDTIGVRLNTEGDMAELIYCLIISSSSARGIMQSATVSPKQYGRLRPGCSWEQEAKKNSKTDDRRNVLTEFEIEDNDGNPTGYYNKKGYWVNPKEVNSPEDYEEDQKNSLWANSYPSGHSSGIFGGSMGLMELMPDKADLILRSANRFAINRTIARYHWTSDTINGRVLGSAQNAISHAASDYDTLLEKAREDIKQL